jgi:hypothetical protein
LTHYTVTSESEVPIGGSVLGVAFDKTGANKGIATLHINGHDEGSVEVVCETATSSLEEGLEVGKDSHTPVTDSYESPYGFNGTLEKVVLEVKD